MSKRILITGGSDGIGKATALALAKQGFEIIITSRTAAKGETAAAYLRTTSGNANVRAVVLDLGDFASVRAVAKRLISEYAYLDVLINNAGLIVQEFQLTPSGFEQQFGVNHLGHFLLTRLLLPLLQASEQGRVIAVSSHAHRWAKFDFDALTHPKGSYNPMRAYANSKLANILFTNELARRLSGTSVTANSLHPGAVRTEFPIKDLRGGYRFFAQLVTPFFISTEQGAQSSVMLATSPDVAFLTGRYFHRLHERKPSLDANNPDLAARLWTASETWTRVNE